MAAEKFRRKQKYPRPSAEEMERLEEEWIRNPFGTQAEFFRLYGWTRDEFYNRNNERINQNET